MKRNPTRCSGSVVYLVNWLQVGCFWIQETKGSEECLSLQRAYNLTTPLTTKHPFLLIQVNVLWDVWSKCPIVWAGVAASPCNYAVTVGCLLTCVSVLSVSSEFFCLFTFGHRFLFSLFWQFYFVFIIYKLVKCFLWDEKSATEPSWIFPNYLFALKRFYHCNICCFLSRYV